MNLSVHTALPDKVLRALTILPMHKHRGIQYCSYQYVNELTKRKISFSMTEENHCYENAIAERVNGILKDEFYLDQCFFNTDHASKATKSAIGIYNNKRIHLSLDYKAPNMIFKMSRVPSEI